MRLISFLAALLFPGMIWAQTCTGTGDRCDLEQGHYHAMLPRGDAIGAVVYLHGYGGRSSAVMRNARLLNRFTDRGYAVLAVQGMPRFSGDNGGSWNSRQIGGRRDDVAFVDTVANDAAERFDIPRDNMILAGFSGGGMMTWVAACASADQFTRYAPVSGTFWNPLPTACSGPVRLRHTHGSSDPVVPLEGRSVNAGGLTQGNVFAALDMMQNSMNCDGAATPPRVQDGAYLQQIWASCDAGGTVIFDLHDGGHNVPQDWAGRLLDWHEQTP